MVVQDEILWGGNHGGVAVYDYWLSIVEYKNALL